MGWSLRLTVIRSDQTSVSTSLDTRESGEVLLDALLAAGVGVPHQCQKSCACASCWVRVIDGAPHLSTMGAAEARLLQAAQRPLAESRLACQARIRGSGDLVVAVPG